jgi:tetratricopeptide (TPR) repeat protein
MRQSSFHVIFTFTLLLLILSSCTGDSSAFTNRGKLLLESGKPEEALLALDSALNINSDDTLALRLRGYANFRTSRFWEAIQDLDKYVELNPSAHFFWLHYFRGISHAVFFDWNSSLVDLNSFIDNPRFNTSELNDVERAVAYSCRGIANLNLGRIDEALRDYDNLKKTDPEFRSDNLTKGLGVKTVEGTEICLTGYDWVYPSNGEVQGAWKFSSDGTFNSSTRWFGGMSAWGIWRVISPGMIRITYTSSRESFQPNDQIINLESCERLLVGSTAYSKQ